MARLTTGERPAQRQVTPDLRLDPIRDGRPYLVTRLIHERVITMALRALNGRQASVIADGIAMRLRNGQTPE